MMSDNEKRSTEATNNRLRARLKNVAELAENALANQPNGIDTCWEHLMGALGRIETEMLIHTAEKPLDPNAPEMVRCEKPDEKKAIGNFAGVGKVVSYAIGRDMTVTVTARTAGEGEWVFEGIKDGKLVIEGNILGGKWAAAQYCKFLRNWIVSRAKKVWKNHHRRLKEAAIETITPENGGSDGAQPSQGEGAAA